MTEVEIVETVRRREAERAKRLASVENDVKEKWLSEMRIHPSEHLRAEHPCRVCGCHLRYAALPDRCLWCEAAN